MFSSITWTAQGTRGKAIRYIWSEGVKRSDLDYTYFHDQIGINTNSAGILNSGYTYY